MHPLYGLERKGFFKLCVTKSVVGSYRDPRAGVMPFCSLRKEPVPHAKERFVIFHPLRSVDIM